MDVKNQTIWGRTSKNRVEPWNIHRVQLQLQHIRQSTKWLGSSSSCQTNLGLVGWKRLGEDQDSKCCQEILWNKETKIQRYILILAKNVFEIHIWYHRLQQGWYHLQWHCHRDVLGPTWCYREPCHRDRFWRRHWVQWCCGSAQSSRSGRRCPASKLYLDLSLSSI